MQSKLKNRNFKAQMDDYDFVPEKIVICSDNRDHQDPEIRFCSHLTKCLGKQKAGKVLNIAKVTFVRCNQKSDHLNPRPKPEIPYQEAVACKDRKDNIIRTPPYPEEMESVLAFMKIEVDKVVRTFSKAGLLDEQKEPLGFWQQFWSGKGRQPNIREYIDKIERRKFLGMTTRGPEKEKKRRAKEDRNLLVNGISQKEALQRRRQRKAWKGKWQEIFPPVVSKTTSKKKKVGKEEAEMKEKEAEAKRLAMVPVNLTDATDASTFERQSIMDLVGIINELIFIKKDLNNF